MAKSLGKTANNSQHSRQSARRRPRRYRQLSFFKGPRPDTKLWWIKNQCVYGGGLNYRKVRRPFDSKKLVHIVFKAQRLPTRSLNFSGHSQRVREMIQESAARYGVKLKDLAINHDHIHLLVWTKYRDALQKTLRLIAAEIGRYYSRLLRKMGVKSPKSLWKYRPFTRLVSWGKKSLASILNYFRKNKLEVMQLVEYTPRNHRLDLFLQKLANSS